MPRTTGFYETTTVAGESVRAFVPRPLPPSKPRLALDSTPQGMLTRAETSMTRLDSAARMVPSVDWFVYAFVRREAVVSSQIEGTQASLTDLLTVEADAPSPAPPEDVREICNYLEALDYARQQVQSKRGLPLSMRLLNGAHKRLLAGSRGESKQPGRVRRSQNWIGGTRPGNARYVPPPPQLLPDLLADLERYLNQENGLSPLVRAGLAHAQFETIHPYLDGNGRVGRLLIALCLEQWDVLKEPVLCLSLFFKRHRQEYYDRLDAIRVSGDWEGWIAFYLEGVAVIAEEAEALIGSLFDLVERDRRDLAASDHATVMAIRLYDYLLTHPIVTVKSVVKLCDTTRPTAAKAVDALCAAGMLEETTGRGRDRTYCYSRYLDQLRVGTELDDL